MVNHGRGTSTIVEYMSAFTTIKYQIESAENESDKLARPIALRTPGP